MTIKSLFSLAACTATLVCTATLSGCTADDAYDIASSAPIIDSLHREVHTARLHMTADLGGFAGAEGETASTRRMQRSGSQWQTDDQVYLQFKTSAGSRVDGVAIYQSDDTWKVNYYGSLPTGVEGQCEAYFFDGAKSASDTEVVLDAHTAIYSDTQATWILDGGEMRVSAHLQPMTGRIRFKSTTGTPYAATGFKCYTNYSITTNTFSSSDVFAEGNVGSDGYTPYYYGFFASESDKTIMFNDADNLVTFSRQLSSTALAQGYSGCLSVPTMTDLYGWTIKDYQNMTITVKGVSFVMVPVKGGTFTMDATEQQGGSFEYPAHQVTLSSYYIGQTEVTQALWKAVMGYSPTRDGSSWSSSYGLGDNYPAYYISYDDILSFITILNNLTGSTFRMPTEAEWEYAARGGSKHKGYLYSGGNTIDDVAWYFNNGEFKTHPVAQKTANELGIYDMSGNVWEWCSDWFGSYSSEAQTNPTGPTSGSDRVVRGGGWNFSETVCRFNYRSKGAPSVRSAITGFRIASSSSH
ncbi:MAG: formylglycine-generating enzyme family protein [Bacteroidales bacterium]|nr:formylglycine-generating enzyme family protein [Bacteroidales bacterium]